MKKLLYIFVLFFGSTACAQSQGDTMLRTLSPRIFFEETDSGTIVNELLQSSCKGYAINKTFIPAPPKPRQKISNSHQEASVKFLTVHGEVSYDYFYRSKIDTPFAQSNFQQHTERVSLNVVFREKYPFKINFASRQSNSGFFRDFNDVNLQFDRFAYNKNIKQQLIDKLQKQQEKLPSLASLDSLLKKETLNLEALKFSINNPATLQKIIEQREAEFRRKNAPANATQPNISALPELSDSDFVFLNKQKQKFSTVKNKIDSAKENFEDAYQQKKEAVDSILKKVAVLQHKADSVKNVAQANFSSIRQKIYNATNEKELAKIATENNLEMNSDAKLNKFLSSVKSFSIGRSVLNYTELTAQNIMVTGINVEYNPSYYVAFAAGKVDYRFRDFFNKRSTQNNQYLALGRVGIGNKDKRAIIFSLFKGRKSLSQYGLSDSINNSINIVGYSLETILRKNENTFFSAEFAKSTAPVTGNLQDNKEMGRLLKFQDRTNMGVNIKGQTVIPETKTRLSGFFRKTGENFQSFSLFSYNTSQTAWLGRADQDFFKRKLGLTAMLRRNDFTNPFTEKTYKTSTTFTSLLLNLRIPKYPVLSVGYYPGTQLYVIDKDRIRENAYYIINGTLNYSYYYKGTGMNSSFLYNRYINKANDSGFVFYKGISLYASQSIFLKQLQLQGGYAWTKQTELQYYSLESSADYSLTQFFKLGASLKYNKVSGGEDYWGERVMMSADMKRLGRLQLQYEKSFLPTISRQLYPVEIGRVSWYKYF